MGALIPSQVSQILAIIERLENEARSRIEIDHAVRKIAPLLFDGGYTPNTIYPHIAADRLRNRFFVVEISSLADGTWEAVARAAGADQTRTFVAGDIGLAIVGLELTVALHERCPVELLDRLSDPTRETA